MCVCVCESVCGEKPQFRSQAAQFSFSKSSHYAHAHAALQLAELLHGGTFTSSGEGYQRDGWKVCRTVFV